jgi:MFS family permease
MRNRNFRQLNLAIFVSSVGDPLTLAVSLVLLYSTYSSALAIGAAYACRVVAALLVGSGIGSLADRLDRRRLVVRLELARCALVATMPIVTSVSVLLVLPYLALLGGIEALVQPARQAAVPHMVGEEQIEVSNSVLMSGFALAQALGFALAGVFLTLLPDPRPLYWADALSFAVAAGLTASLPSLGGGLRSVRFLGGLGSAMRLPVVRPLLLGGGAANLMIGMGLPAILPIAFLLSGAGAAAYTLLEVAVIGGILVGSVLAAHISPSRTVHALAASLWLFSAACLVVALTPLLLGAVLAMAASGTGNAVFAVSIRSALMRAAPPHVRGTVMAVRFSLTQAAQVLGLGLGALVVAAAGARWDFVLVAAGLGAVALVWSVYRRRLPVAGEVTEAGRISGGGGNGEADQGAFWA